ncbi:hypothetical protein QE380_002273 [Acinetobacter baylyi]|uniref:Uncharacterized protein n=1 Tax=Acinetobacter baylyi TaxID=202950 RepID=A0ABU0UXR2_ACIBI|nr:hypothetical protein [Acinetobacter baylyi]MDQ1209350.1 hypothetical protein [Acinetobacter baylyi]MDR6107057.1 hypothetical protein [Acinetobacter baylyi]MDR6186221.1 hypothetical protein [Acinetobacter baylyi]
MNKTFDFNEKFGFPKELICKKFNKMNISIHPSFAGIYLCYQEAFKSLKADLSILTSCPVLSVWKDPNIAGYTIAKDFMWHLSFSQNIPKNIKLLVYSFPSDEEKIKLLKRMVSSEFLGFLPSFHHNLNKMNPQKLLNLINTHISSEAILILNKEKSFKPHSSMSLDLLAKLVSYTRNQLNYRNRVIFQERQNVLNQLEQTSQIAQQLLNDSGLVLSTELLWKQQ